MLDAISCVYIYNSHLFFGSLYVSSSQTSNITFAYCLWNAQHSTQQREMCKFYIELGENSGGKKIKAWLAFFLGTSSTLLCYGIGYISIARSNFSCRCAQAKSKRQKQTQ